MVKYQTRSKAEQLLENVQNYWASQGYDVQGTIVEGQYSPRLRSTVYEIHTDLVGGQPKNYVSRRG